MAKRNLKLKGTLLLLTMNILHCQLINAQSYSHYVNPFIGTEGKGNVFIGPSCPFGMVKPGPDCSISSNSGYVSDTLQPVYGFSQVHVSGTGGGPKYGNILLMPFRGDFTSIDQKALRSKERARTGYYGVWLKDKNIQVELTTGNKVAFHRYCFYSDSQKGIKIDAGAFLGEESIPDAREAQQFVGSEIEIVSDTEVRGYSRIRGGWNNGKAYTVYFFAVFDQPFTSFGTWKGDQIFKGSGTQIDTGEKTGTFLHFSQSGADTILVKIGISFISSLKARYNMEEEIPDWDFEKVVQETENKWEELLGRIEIDTRAPDSQKTMFYTALYHTMLMPVDRTEENPMWISSQPYYDDFYAIWDTYRSSFPLITLIDPKRQSAIINALLDIYKYDGYLPDARSGNCNGRTQGGSNADIVIADAYVKGLKGINYGLALKAMLKNAMIPPGDNEEKEGRGGLTDYNSLGYVSTQFVRAGNRTLEYAYNDYCISQVARGLGRMGEYRRLRDQSDNWKNLWRDAENNGFRGFIMPKDPSGRWVDSVPCDIHDGRQEYVPYTPLSQEWPICVCWWCGFFYEGTSWEYSFMVPHDIETLIELAGGPDTFTKRLDTFFGSEFYNVSNEPSFLTPCLYHWVGRPDLSSDRIRQIINSNFDSSPEGLPGNDDSGAMSSWLAFHMMGLYPNAGQSYYLIHTPYLAKTTIHLGNNSDFTIIAKNLSEKNRYIVSASLNGKPLERAWIDHSEILEGGRLILKMGPAATRWGDLILPPGKNR